MTQSADCSVNAVIELLGEIDTSLTDPKMAVMAYMGEDWYKNTRPGGPGIDLTLLYVNMLDLFEALDLDQKYEITCEQLDGDRYKQYLQFLEDSVNGHLIINYIEADRTQNVEDEQGHFSFFPSFNSRWKHAHMVLYNSMRSIDPETGTARGYILIKERGI